MLKYSFLFILFIIIGYFFLHSKEEERFFGTKTAIRIFDEDQEIYVGSSNADTVEALVKEKGILLEEGDSIFPDKNSTLTSGIKISIIHQKQFSLEVDQKKEQFSTYEKTVENALYERKIVLGEDDIVEPVLESSLSDKSEIKITRVVISEETEETSIPFKTETKEDNELSWRKKEIKQKGEKGILETRLRIARHDGKEVKRTILSKTITKEPVTEIEVQGTYVKTGKSHSGGASWYAHTGTLAAANPWLPFGSYVKVTNTANGKSVIVKINDRGPFGGGRIIDLDKVAFQEIASLGEGVVNVKMEEITN